MCKKAIAIWMILLITVFDARLGHTDSDNAKGSAEADIIINAIADTYVSEEHTGTNYGLKETVLLSASAGKKKIIYVSFCVKHQLGDFDKVVYTMKPLKIVKEGEAKTSKISIYQATVHDLYQLKLNWSNAPAKSTLISDVDVAEGEEFGIDVTNYVKSARDARGFVSFVIEEKDDTGSEVMFSSSENSNSEGPKLKIYKDVLRPTAEDAAASKELVVKKINDKFAKVPDIPGLAEDVNIDELTVTYYKPWMLNYHLTSPTQIKNGYYGGEAGQMGWSLAVSPTRPDRLLLGSDTESVWRSENGGVSWVASNKGIAMIGTTAITFHPDDENIAFVQTNNGSNSKQYPKCGMYKSVDGGKSWKQVHVNSSAREKQFQAFAFGPKNKDGNRRIYYISNYKQGLLASDDNGESWKTIGLVGISTEAVMTVGNLLVVSSSTDGILVSRDNGVTWEPRNEGRKIAGVRSVAVKPTDENYWICATFDNLIYTSKDGGHTWEYTNNNSMLSNVNIYRLMFGAPKEDGHSILYAMIGTIQYTVRYSNDYGLTFAKPTHHNKDAFIMDNWGWGTEPTQVHPTDPYTLFSIFDGEVYKSTDGGVSFYPSCSGYSGFRASDFAFNPNNPNDFYITFVDRGFVHSMDTGRGEKYPMVDYFPSEDRFWIRHYGSKTVGGIAINWDNPKEIWITIGSWGKSIVKRSTDGGRTFSVVPGTENMQYGQIRIHPQNPDVIYAPNAISYDHGKTWNRIPYLFRAVSPVNGDIVYAREELNAYRSTDQGRTWQPISNTPIKYSQKFNCDLFDEDKVYIGWNGGVYIVDGDKVFNAPVGAGRFDQVAQDPKDPLHLITAQNDQGNYYVSRGVYESFDGGLSWRIVEGLGGTADVWSVAFHPTLPRVYFGTSNGTWVYELEKYYNMKEHVYLDVKKGHYAKDIIEDLYYKGFLNQYHDGYFKPNDGMRRADFASMLCKSIDAVRVQTTQTFNDVPVNSIYYVDLQAMFERGIISPLEDGNFYPKKEITYDDAAVMMWKTLRYLRFQEKADISQMGKYADDSVPENVRYAIFQLRLLGIIDDSISYKSGNTATNTDIAVMFHRYLDLIQ